MTAAEAQAILTYPLKPLHARKEIPRQHRSRKTPISPPKSELFARGLQTIRSTVRWEMIRRGDSRRTGRYLGPIRGDQVSTPGDTRRGYTFSRWVL